jgi:hypothetical protein
MYGTDIALKHEVSKARYLDLVAEAERQRAGAEALAARPRSRRSGSSEIRTAIAAGLLRAGSWLMPDEAVDRGTYAGDRALAFRTGH